MLSLEMFEQFNINQDTKVVVVSHNDLDGVGPIIIAKNYFKDCAYFTVANKAVNKIVKMVLFSEQFEDREVLFITDCSIDDPELIETVDKINQKTNGKIFLFDHHGTALNLNQYDWAHVTQEKGVSGTKLFWKYLEQKVAEVLPTDRFIKIDNLVNKISDYDTWQWVEKCDNECKVLSELYSNTGVNYFIQKYVGEALESYSQFNIFNKIDLALIEDNKTKFDYIISPAIKRSAKVIDYFNFEIKLPNGMIEITTKKVKCVTIANAIGDMAEQLYEDGIDYVLFFYHDSISARSRVDDIDLGAWAKQWGGGGHKRSAGFTLTENNFYLYKNYLNLKFNHREEK